MYEYHCDVATWWESICGGGSKAPYSSPEVIYTKKLAPYRSDSTDSEESPTQQNIQGRTNARGIRREIKSDQYYRNLHNEFIESILFEELEETAPKEMQKENINMETPIGDAASNMIGEQSKATAAHMSKQMRDGSSSSLRSFHSLDDEKTRVTYTGRRSPLKPKKRTFLRRLNPSQSHPPPAGLLPSSTRSKVTSADFRHKTNEKTQRLRTEPISTPPKEKAEIKKIDNRSPSIIRPVSKRKIKRGELHGSSILSVRSESMDLIPVQKPSTYYLMDDVLFYKDRSPNPGESFYVFDPTDNVHFSVVQGKSAALGKLREKTSLLSSNQTAASTDSADDFVVDGSLNETPRLVRAPSSQGKGYNFKRTPSGVSSFIGHDVNAISVNQGFLPDGVVETRSILKIKIGFLRMNYGILLRWNAKGKITVIVLKKNTSSSFLNEIPFARKLPVEDPPAVSHPLPGIASFFKNCSPALCDGIETDSFEYDQLKHSSRTIASFPLDLVDTHPNGSCTVVKCCADGTSETTLLTAPFLVPQPDSLLKRQPMLYVRVINALLPHRKAGGAVSHTPYVKLSLGQTTNRTNVGRRVSSAFNNDLITWNFDKGNGATFYVSDRHKALELELCDSLRKKHLHGGSLGFGRILLSDLEVCHSKAPPSQAKVVLYSDITCRKVTNGSVTLEIRYVHHLKNWVKEEFQARQGASHIE